MEEAGSDLPGLCKYLEIADGGCPLSGDVTLSKKAVLVTTPPTMHKCPSSSCATLAGEMYSKDNEAWESVPLPRFMKDIQ